MDTEGKAPTQTRSNGRSGVAAETSEEAQGNGGSQKGLKMWLSAGSDLTLVRFWDV